MWRVIERAAVGAAAGAGWAGAQRVLPHALYVDLSAVVIAAILGGIAWMLWDRRRMEHVRLRLAQDVDRSIQQGLMEVQNLAGYIAQDSTLEPATRKKARELIREYR